MKQYISIKAFFCLCLLAFIFIVPGCKKQEYIKTSAIKPEKRIEEFRLSNASFPAIIKLYNDTVYILDIDFTREAGQQLIIEEGTLIKAGVRSISNLGSSNPSKGSIVINPGGILIANGTRNQPIIFTSNVLKSTQSVNWGGITILGKSTNNDVANPVNVDVTDFSGSLNFCRIEFAPLTLRGVGSSTIIENVMVSYTMRNGVSAYNIYGGTFNAKNLISYACAGPADYYITNGYTGKMQNVLAYRNPFFGETGTTPQNALCGIFFENNPFNPTVAKPFTFPTISNLTVIGPNNRDGSTPQYGSATTRAAAIITTGSACFNLSNSLFMGFPKACWVLDDANTASAVQSRVNVISYSIFQAMDTSRVFDLEPGSYPPYSSYDFRNFVLAPALKNQVFLSVGDFSFTDIFNYNNPGLLPKENSVVLTGANFQGIYTDAFFTPSPNLGAFGKDEWYKEWANFTPLKTNYNFPE
ncbi:MAG: hypothetical protein ABJB11_12990 [Ferruginibacter sp.]